MSGALAMPDVDLCFQLSMLTAKLAPFVTRSRAQ